MPWATLLRAAALAAIPLVAGCMLLDRPEPSAPQEGLVPAEDTVDAIDAIRFDETFDDAIFSTRNLKRRDR